RIKPQRAGASMTRAARSLSVGFGMAQGYGERMRTLVVATLVALTLLVTACTDPPDPPPSASVTPTATRDAPAAHRIGIDGGVFTDASADGAPWTPRGVNYVRLVDGRDRVFSPGVWDAARM